MLLLLLRGIPPMPEDPLVYIPPNLATLGVYPNLSTLLLTPNHSALEVEGE